jgi:membrane-associated phospholipid phosphatase
MAIREQKHLHEIQLIEVKGQLSLNKLGILGGIFLVGLMLFSTVYCAMHGQKEVAIAIATGAGFIGVAGVFLRNYLTKSPPPASSPPIGGDDDDDDDDDPAATSLDRTA